MASFQGCPLPPASRMPISTTRRAIVASSPRHPVVQIKFLLWSGEGVQAWAWCQAAHSSLSLPRDEEDNVRLLIPGGNLSGSQ